MDENRPSPLKEIIGRNEGSIPFTRSNFAAHSAATVSKLANLSNQPIYNQSYNTFTVLYSCLRLSAPFFSGAPRARRAPDIEHRNLAKPRILRSHLSPHSNVR